MGAALVIGAVSALIVIVVGVVEAPEVVPALIIVSIFGLVIYAVGTQGGQRNVNMRGDWLRLYRDSYMRSTLEEHNLTLALQSGDKRAEDAAVIQIERERTLQASLQEAMNPSEEVIVPEDSNGR